MTQFFGSAMVLSLAGMALCVIWDAPVWSTRTLSTAAIISLVGFLLS